LSRLKTSLPEALAAAVKTNIADWKTGDKVARLWQHDASLWTGDDEASWLGWRA
jgi:transaldolase/glucose-6-phosphate isomerase